MQNNPLKPANHPHNPAPVAVRGAVSRGVLFFIAVIAISILAYTQYKRMAFQQEQMRQAARPLFVNQLHYILHTSTRARLHMVDYSLSTGKLLTDISQLGSEEKKVITRHPWVSGIQMDGNGSLIISILPPSETGYPKGTLAVTITITDNVLSWKCSTSYDIPLGEDFKSCDVSPP